jgi:hypothetical protein
MFLPATLDQWLQGATYVIAILAALGSLWQYRRNSKRERTRWLFELYQRFYDQNNLKAMRVRIDGGDTKFITEGRDNFLLADLDDFLNFFELIAYLQKRDDLLRKEVLVMFEYPLRMIAQDQAVFGYVSQYGYDELRGLLKELEYVGQRISST